ncbi:MAG: DUF5682 family protein [Deferribacteraceae bacterium]|jgi:hypothetical protein|nr:DUF5682 family protein [Deferribacteraceae bacterium]
MQDLLNSGVLDETENWRTADGVRLFGIRHLSAGGAWHIRRFLDKTKPDIVLIENPSDAEHLIEGLTGLGVKMPVAILCYTVQLPVHSIVYPFASYSPEYQSMLWAKDNKKSVRFIDLPSNIKAPLYRLEEELHIREASGGESSPERIAGIEFYRYRKGLYETAAKLGGEDDYDAYWERHFEHNLETDSYLRSVALHSAEMRRLSEGWEKEVEPLSFSVNALRESYMKRQIGEAVKDGYLPEKIVAVLGAYHLTGVMNAEPMSNEELASLPRLETKMTLMPYTYYRLSTFSGYGAGNYAPYYYELMYKAMQTGDLETLPSRYIAALSAIHRKKQGYSSTATAIEAVRLARSIQFMHGGLLPTLKDLHDSAVATMAEGSFAEIAETFASLDVGLHVGELPEGVSQTPIQDDMNRFLKKLKLERFKTPVAQDLELDLRENLKVKGEESAFLDLERSIFLNRLDVLDIGFAKQTASRQESATWREKWVLCWTPEVEIRLVESVLYGDTAEVAASYIIKEKLEKAGDVAEVAKLVSVACECNLKSSVLDAIKKLQALASETESFTASAQAAREMSFLVKYGSIRRFDTEAVIPILQQLFLKGALLLYGASSCDYKTASDIADNMAAMHYITREQESVQDAIWLKQLKLLAFSDEKNPLLSGFAFSILLERGEITESELSREVSRRLSAGNTPEAGAAWFEGLARRNRYLLLSRIFLWKQLDEYIDGLDDDEYKVAMLSLRRAFSCFEAREKTGICEILADIWGFDAQSTAEILQDTLSEGEEEALKDLNDFDLGDL